MDPGITDRQSQIVELLTDQTRPVSVPEVARRLGVSERTVHRDVEALRRMAVEITTEPGRSGGLLLARFAASAVKPRQPASSHATCPAVVRSPGDEFVGRGSESDQLDQLLDEAIGGHGRIAMILGEPGIGKTRLAQELAARAEARGAVAEWGRCRDIQGAPPYWPWTQVIRALSAERGVDLAAAVASDGAAAVAGAIPEMAQIVGGSALVTGIAGDGSPSSSGQLPNPVKSWGFRQESCRN